MTAPETSDPSREERPGGEWRADSLARSRHARLDTALEPLAETDSERAAALCAEVCRAALGDFAPALVLLPPAERRRCQALVAHVRVLFDFARDQGVEGERLAQINRWQFALDSALAGDPAGQPVFLAMAAEHARRPWPEAALDRLAAAARLAVTRPIAATPEEAGQRAAAAAGAAVEALLGAPAPEDQAAFGAALLRLHALQHLSGALARNRWPLAGTDLEPAGVEPARLPPAAILAAVRRECERLRPALLRGARAVGGFGPRHRRAAAFALHGSLALLGRLEQADAALLARPPRLGFLARLVLLARARWM